jgi:hypothetical protein
VTQERRPSGWTQGWAWPDREQWRKLPLGEAIRWHLHKRVRWRIAKLGRARARHDVAALARDGVLVVPDFVPPSVCDRWAQAVSRLVDGPRPDVGGALVMVRDPDGRKAFDTGMIDVRRVHRSIPELAEFRYDPRLPELIRLASGFAVRSARLNCYVNERVASPRIFHADVLHYLEFKAMLLLTDVLQPAHGAHAYVRGSHHRLALKLVNLGYNLVRPYTHRLDGRIFSRRDVKVLCLRRGALILTDVNGLHRGLPQHPGAPRRVMLVNTFARIDDIREDDD